MGSKHAVGRLYKFCSRYQLELLIISIFLRKIAIKPCDRQEKSRIIQDIRYCNDNGVKNTTNSIIFAIMAE